MTEKPSWNDVIDERQAGNSFFTGNRWPLIREEGDLLLTEVDVVLVPFRSRSGCSKCTRAQKRTHSDAIFKFPFPSSIPIHQGG